MYMIMNQFLFYLFYKIVKTMKHTLPVREMRHKLAKFKKGKIFLHYKVGVLGFKDIVIISFNDNRGTVGFLETIYDI